MTWAQLWGRLGRRTFAAEGRGRGRRTFAANDLGAALGTWKSAAWECSGVSSKPTLRLRRKPHKSQACAQAHVRVERPEQRAYAQAHIAATWKSAAWECSGVSSKPTLRLRRLTSMSYTFCPRSLRGVSAQSWESTKRQRTYTETSLASVSLLEEAKLPSLSKSVFGMSEHFTGGALNVTEM